jgi:beta-galactosidase
VVKVYSNCESAELFLNGVSVGSNRRDSQDFPAAGLRWSVAFQEGENHLRVIATKGSAKVTDEIELHYQTQPWGKPAMLKLTAAGSAGGVRTVEAKLYDAAGVLCLDARNEVRFSLAGAGRLIDNMGTSRGSRQLQLANGRARISFTQTGSCAVAVTSDGLPAALLDFASVNSTAQL